MSQTVAQYLAAQLPELGVTHVFELVGGMVTVILDSLHQNPLLTVISMRHEQGAGFAAEGHARITGRPAVALATSGPGATNLLTAVGSCYFDSVPVVYITGQVNRDEIRREGRGRQGGFQETDIVSMARPITKWAVRVLKSEEFPAILDRAFRVATTGRPGPVLLDIPMDVQRSSIGQRQVVRTRNNDTGNGGSPEFAPIVDGIATVAERTSFLSRLSEALRVSQRPLVLAGGGVRSPLAVAAFRAGVDDWRIPVVTSLLGLDAIASDSPLRVGFIGSYGNRWANKAVSEADLLLVIGSRLDIRQTGSDVAGFAEGRQIFHVDVDATELNNHVSGCDVLCDDLAAFLPAAAAGLEVAGDRWRPWHAALEDLRRAWPDMAENIPGFGPNPNAVMRLIGASWPGLAAVVTDVGQHQMWAAQSFQLTGSQRFLTSGGMGSMGFGLPAAIGAAVHLAPRPVCLIAGDGGFQVNIQELQALVHLKLPLRIVVIDNGAHGMVRQFQESYFGKRYYSTMWGYSAPDFCAVSRAYGIPAWHADEESDFEAALRKVAGVASGPSLLHIKIDPDLNVYPKMAFGQPFGSMEPLVAPTEMEGT